jgi:hypothetical protein
MPRGPKRNLELAQDLCILTPTIARGIKKARATSPAIARPCVRSRHAPAPATPHPYAGVGMPLRRTGQAWPNFPNPTEGSQPALRLCGFAPLREPPSKTGIQSASASHHAPCKDKEKSEKRNLCSPCNLRPQLVFLCNHRRRTKKSKKTCRVRKRGGARTAKLRTVPTTSLTVTIQACPTPANAHFLT